MVYWFVQFSIFQFWVLQICGITLGMLLGIVDLHLLQEAKDLVILLVFFVFGPNLQHKMSQFWITFLGKVVVLYQ